MIRDETQVKLMFRRSYLRTAAKRYGDDGQKEQESELIDHASWTRVFGCSVTPWWRPEELLSHHKLSDPRTRNCDSASPALFRSSHVGTRRIVSRDCESGPQIGGWMASFHWNHINMEFDHSRAVKIDILLGSRQSLLQFGVQY